MHSKKVYSSAKLSLSLILLAVVFLTSITILFPSSALTPILFATTENEEDDSGDGDGGDSSDGDNGSSDQPDEESPTEPQPQSEQPQPQSEQPQPLPQQPQSQQPQQQQPSQSIPPQDGQQQQPPLQNFIISGKIVSLLPIENNTWIADGDWRMAAENGKAKSFSTQMVWTSADGTQSHTHEFQNFKLLDNDTNVAMGPGNILILDGVLDVGTNRIIDWPSVPSRLYFGNGQTIVVAVDNEATNFHFGGQPIYGLVTSFSPCGAPGPSMEVLPRCE